MVALFFALLQKAEAQIRVVTGEPALLFLRPIVRERLACELDTFLQTPRGLPLKTIRCDEAARTLLLDQVMTTLTEVELAAQLLARLVVALWQREMVKVSQLQAAMESLAQHKLVVIYDVREEGVYIELL